MMRVLLSGLMTVVIIEGNYDNIKITTPEDYILQKQFYKKQGD